MLPSSVSGLEESVFRFVNDWPDGLEAPTWPVMQAGALFVIPVVAAVFLALRRYRVALAVGVAGLAAWALAKVVKEVVGRGRPEAFLDDVNLRPAWDGLGFVSGHAAVAFALAAVVSPLVTRAWRIAIWTVAVATAVLRMYTAAHLPLDVIGGAGLGLTIGAVVRLAIPPRHSQETVAAEREST